MDYFRIRRVSTGYKFDLRSANGEVIATSEVFKSEAACRKSIASVRRNAPVAYLADLTLEEICPNPRFEVYLDRSGQYRFRLRSRNGNIIAASENYTAKSNCLDGIDAVRRYATCQEDEIPCPESNP